MVDSLIAPRLAIESLLVELARPVGDEERARRLSEVEACLTALSETARDAVARTGAPSFAAGELTGARALVERELPRRLGSVRSRGLCCMEAALYRLELSRAECERALRELDEAGARRAGRARRKGELDGRARR